MGVDQRNHLFAPGLSSGWVTGTPWSLCSDGAVSPHITIGLSPVVVVAAACPALRQRCLASHLPRSKNMDRFRVGLVFKAHRLLYHSILGSTVIKKKV